MRHVSLKMLSQCMMAAALFLSPLLSMADVACRCPDCTRRECLIKSRVCDCKDCAASTPGCTGQDPATCQGCARPTPPSRPSDPDTSEHAPASKACDCNAYIYTHGNAVLPGQDTGPYAAAAQFYQQPPTTVIASGWVHQILHPPRRFPS